MRPNLVLKSAVEASNKRKLPRCCLHLLNQAHMQISMCIHNKEITSSRAWSPLMVLSIIDVCVVTESVQATNPTLQSIILLHLVELWKKKFGTLCRYAHARVHAYRSFLLMLSIKDLIFIDQNNVRSGLNTRQR